ncbi:Patatin-like protein 2 [Vitis vinifera]|uniref:Patatin-like protein 2 n=1 Tax=Vitis vinifera TaxID=29760 RepID=A0A438K1K7_VITVI|nr:Patatin-like protein 2 [Vitis vinifera]
MANRTIRGCIQTPCPDVFCSSAAPTYFPAYFFKNQDKEGKARELNLIDGGVAANNPNRNTMPKWQPNGVFWPGWLLHGGSTPLVDVFTQASADMVDFHISVVFQALHSEDNYLRIQDDTLHGTDASVDVTTKENLGNLVKIGERLLKKPVSRVNLETGLSVPVENCGTNEEALKRFAKLLSDEKRLRETRSPNPKKNLK